MDKWLQKDISVKLLSVAIALVLWFQVMGEENPAIERTFASIPVSTENLAQDQVLLDWQPKTIDVTVKGPRNLLGNVARDDIEALVDLRGFGEGHGIAPVEVTAPRGVTVVESVPSMATVVVDTITEKAVKVSIDVRGEPAEDYEALSAEIELEEVTAIGPRTRLAMVDHALGTVDITGASGERQAISTLAAVGADGGVVEGVSLQPGALAVTVPMRQLPPSKVVAVKPDVQGTPARGFKVASTTVQPSSVKVRASASSLANLHHLVTETVSVQGHEAGTVSQQVGLMLPSGIFSVEPARVTVAVILVQDRVTKEFEVPVVLRNVGTGLRWQIQPSYCLVTVAGLEADLERVTEDKVGVSVDARGLQEGVHILEVLALLPERVELERLEPSTVEVTLTRRQ
ncbi:MAG: CdaR family protein [Bacillota bacterium]|jgi:YbbR domain-containing protein